MGKKEMNSAEVYTVDLLYILRALWKKAWIVVLSGILAAALGFGYSTIVIAPQYSSSIMLYVNNGSIALGDTSFNISASQINAAQSLVRTYGEILKNRTTMEMIIEKSGVAYTAQQLSDMIETGQSNGTEIMKVTVTAEDPYEAAEIANCIAQVLPVRISEIINGATMEVVDDAVADLNKVSPSISKYTAVATIMGVVLAAAVIAVLAMMDDRIHNEEYVIQRYDFPVLARVPNLLSVHGRKYGYRKYGDN